jgi:hypothetical protein
LELLESSRDVNYFYEKTVASTWDISLLRIEKHEPHAAQLLRILAFLDPDGVPELLLINGSAAFHWSPVKVALIFFRTEPSTTVP